MAFEEQAEALLLGETDEDVAPSHDCSVPVESQDHPTPISQTVPLSAPASSDITAVFSLFQNYLDKKLVTLKDDLRDEAQIASGSQDEKRIRKAEQAALRKRNNKLREKNVRRLPPYTRSSSFLAHSPVALASNNLNSTHVGHRPPRKAAATDICFACGLQGHWRADCRRISSRYSQASSSTYQPVSGGNTSSHIPHH